MMLFRVLLILLQLCNVLNAWTIPFPSTARGLSSTTRLQSLEPRKSNHESVFPTTTRRHFFEAATIISSSCLIPSTASNALVKGNAPPPPRKRDSTATTQPKCSNVEECQEMAEKRRDEEIKAAQEAATNDENIQVTAKGTRYRDFEIGNPEKGTVKEGDEVTLYYKVLKLGKRSYDGISGEGTVVFSRGYGFEDDENEAGSKSFVTTVGSLQNIVALNDALLGMHVGGIRRFTILPQRGWERATKQCDGGPGGSGAGGELKTDYVVVPTATMVQTESCFDQTKLPFPATYAQQRRMAQRFDQSLIMEAQVVSVNTNPELGL